MPNLAGSAQDLDASLNTMITGFKLLPDAKAYCKKCATHHTLEAHTGRSKVLLNYGRFVGYDLQDGVDMVQAQSLSDAQTTITPNEVGVQTIVPDTTLRRVADSAMLKRIGQIMRNAYNLKEDSDGTDMFSSWTPTLGAAGTVLGVGHFAAAWSRIAVGNNRANPEPYIDNEIYGIFNPITLHPVWARLIPLTDVPTGTSVYATTSAGATVGPGRSSGMSDDLLRSGPSELVGYRLGGVTVYPDANVSVDSSDDAINAIFAKEGFLYCSEVEASMRPQERDESLRGIELNVIGSYAWQLYRVAATGVAVTMDATLPTA